MSPSDMLETSKSCALHCFVVKRTAHLQAMGRLGSPGSLTGLESLAFPVQGRPSLIVSLQTQHPHRALILEALA